MWLLGCLTKSFAHFDTFYMLFDTFDVTRLLCMTNLPGEKMYSLDSTLCRVEPSGIWALVLFWTLCWIAFACWCSEERIRNGAKKLEKSRTTVTQGRLDNFFQVVSFTSAKRKVIAVNTKFRINLVLLGFPFACFDAVGNAKGVWLL